MTETQTAWLPITTIKTKCSEKRELNSVCFKWNEWKNIHGIGWNLSCKRLQKEKKWRLKNSFISFRWFRRRPNCNNNRWNSWKWERSKWKQRRIEIRNGHGHTVETAEMCYHAHAYSIRQYWKCVDVKKISMEKPPKPKTKGEFRTDVDLCCFVSSSTAIIDAQSRQMNESEWVSGRVQTNSSAHTFVLFLANVSHIANGFYVPWIRLPIFSLCQSNFSINICSSSFAGIFGTSGIRQSE